MSSKMNAFLAIAAASLLTTNASADGNVPASAKTKALRVHVQRGGADHTVRVTVAPGLHDYYVFPAFELDRARISYSDDTSFSGDEPLITRDGRINSAHDRRHARIDIDVADLMDGPDGEKMMAAIAAMGDVHGKDALQPDLQDEWTATLEMRDADNGGEYAPLGKAWKFTRDGGSGKLKMRFLFDPDSGFLYKARGEDLRLTISGHYTAKFTKTDFRVAGEFMDDQVKEVVNKVTSVAGDQQAVLFVNVGGNVDHSFSFSDMFKRTLQISIERRQGVDASKLPDWDLVNTFIGRTMTEFETKVKLSEQSQDTVVSFLLSNGVRVTTPIGEVKKVTDYFKTETDRKTRDLLETLHRDHTKVGVTTKASVDILDIIGASGSMSFDYDHMTEDQKKEERERFAHDLNEMNKMVEGSFPTVATMKLSDMQRLASGGFFRASLESSTFEEGTKEFPVRMSFDAPELAAQVEASAEFIRALRTRIDAARNDFDGYQEGHTVLPGTSFETLNRERYLGTELTEFGYGSENTQAALVALDDMTKMVTQAVPGSWKTWEENTGVDRKMFARDASGYGPWVEVSLMYFSTSYDVLVTIHAPKQS
jgi:hypothetical protein